MLAPPPGDSIDSGAVPGETAGVRLALVLPALMVAQAATAAPGDFRLNARNKAGEGILFNGSTPDAAKWTRFTTELAYVLAPRLVEPAETLGYGGFQIAMMWGANVVSAGDGLWDVTERAQADGGSAAGVVQTLALDVKKGLPFSFEIGGSFAWLAESSLFAPGLELRWTAHEGFGLTPDFGLRGAVTHMVGSRDLNLTTVAIDAVISKGFGIGGMLHLAPYLSWSFLLISASSRVVDPTPTVETDFGANFVFPELSAGDNVHHRLTIGARALFSVLNLSAQGDFEMLEKGPDGTSFFGSVATFSVKLGIEY